MRYCPTSVEFPDWMSTSQTTALWDEVCRQSATPGEIDDNVRRLLAVAEKEHRQQKFVEAICAFGKPVWPDLLPNIGAAGSFYWWPGR